MKIHEIAVENLNSLYGKHRIDLERDLSGAPLFLIQGPTGSGKSTLMDAISLALFGTTPRMSGERSEQTIAEQVMSRGTGACSAELVFSKPGRGRGSREFFRARWVARRAHGKPHGRTQPTIRSLDRRTAAGEWEAIVEDKREKTYAPHFEEVLEGFSVEDFQRSMLLAQGQFDKMLNADPGERARILERLTQTDEYLVVGARAARMAAAWRARLGELKARVGALEVVSDDALQELVDAESKVRERVQKIERRQAELQAVRDWRTTLRERETEFAVAEAELLVARSDQAARAADFKRLAAWEEARDALGLLNALAEDEKEAAELGEALEKLSPEHDAKVKATAASGTALDAAEGGLKAARTVVTELKPHISAVQAKAEQARSAKRDLKKLEVDLGSHESQVAAEEAHAKDARGSLAEVWEALRASRSECPAGFVSLVGDDLPSRLGELDAEPDPDQPMAPLRSVVQQVEGDLKSKRRAYEQLLAARQAVDTLNTRCATKETAVSKAEGEVVAGTELVGSATAGVDAAKETLAARDQVLEPLRRIESLAEERRELNPGERCPLCGSEDHPGVDTDGAFEDVYREAKAAYAAANSEVEQAERRHKEAREALVAKSTTHTSLEAELKALRDDLKVADREWNEVANRFDVDPAIGHAELATTRDALDPAADWVGAVRERIHTVELRQKAVVNHKNRLKQLSESGAAFAQKIDAARKLKKAAVDDLEAARRTVVLHWRELDMDEELASRVSEDLLTSDPPEALERLETWRDGRERVRENTREALTNAQSAEHASQSKIEALQVRLEGAHKRRESNSDKLEKKLGALGLDTREDLAARRMPEDERSEIEAARAQINRRIESAETLSKDRFAALDAHRDARPARAEDFPGSELASKLEQKTEELTTARKDHVEASAALKNAEDERKRAATAEQELRAATAKADVWERLHELIGVGDGQRFREFAQALNLGQLLTQANRHLETLNDRYRLRPIREEETGLPTLEFEIVDLWRPGSARSLKTLSGGESFLTSLALALGLSDLRTSSMPVETLLLDEGFGTLDPDTLDTALAALQQLHSTGRQVGIISHVAGLEERIDARIRVEQLGNGHSRVETAVGQTSSV